MRFISSIGFAACVAALNAASFSAPIYSVDSEAPFTYARQRHAWRERAIKNARSNSHRSPTRSRRMSQKSILGDWRADFLGNKAESGSLSAILEDESSEPLPIWDFTQTTYFTLISVGTPPQPFNMMLSISDSDLVIPSASCNSGCQGRNTYNSSLSSSYIEHDHHFSTFITLRFFADGLLSQDDVFLGVTKIAGQMFGELTRIQELPNFKGVGGWDGLLGLAPANTQSDLGLLNPFQEMVSQNLLKRNLVSLRLPRHEKDKGEVMFGDVNHDLYEGNLVRLPLVERPKELPRVRGRWVVEVNSIGAGSGSFSLDGYVATLETDFPLIAVPKDLVVLLDRYMGVEKAGNPTYPPSIDCERRKDLGNLTVTLGGKDFVLTPWDYTIEDTKDFFKYGVAKKRCVSAFMPLPDFIEEKYIVLGSSFLRSFYGVFDLDDKSVSLARATSQRIKKPKSEDKLDWAQEEL